MWKLFISLAPLKLCSQDQSNQILYQCTVQDELCTPNGFLSRESSAEPDRPASQLSGAGKRKNSPKFHFLKNRRKPVQPARREPGTPDPQQRDGGGTPTEQQREAGTPGEQFRGEGTPDGSGREESIHDQVWDLFYWSGMRSLFMISRKYLFMINEQEMIFIKSKTLV